MKEFLNIGKNIWPDSIWIGKEDILWKPFFEINIFNEWEGNNKVNYLDGPIDGDILKIMRAAIPARREY